jgi:hypothetical protein
MTRAGSAITISAMRSWGARSAAIGLMLLMLFGSCSLTSFDDIQGGTVDAASCVVDADCSGCASCAKRCACTDPTNFQLCYQSRCPLDGGGARGGSSDAGAS